MTRLIDVSRTRLAFVLAAPLLLSACELPFTSQTAVAPSPAEESSRAAAALRVESSADLKSAQEALGRRIDNWNQPAVAAQSPLPAEAVSSGGLVEAVTTDPQKRQALTEQIQALEAKLHARTRSGTATP